MNSYTSISFLDEIPFPQYPLPESDSTSADKLFFLDTQEVLRKFSPEPIEIWKGFKRTDLFRHGYLGRDRRKKDIPLNLLGICERRNRKEIDHDYRFLLVKKEPSTFIPSDKLSKLLLNGIKKPSIERFSLIKHAYNLLGETLGIVKASDLPNEFSRKIVSLFSILIHSVSSDIDELTILDLKPKKQFSDIFLFEFNRYFHLDTDLSIYNEILDYLSIELLKYAKEQHRPWRWGDIICNDSCVKIKINHDVIKFPIID